MIIKRNFNLVKVFWYVRAELMWGLITSVLAYILVKVLQLPYILPFQIPAILGSALAIFIGFRNNSSYQRWWEARTIWGNIINNSRIFARQIIANTENAEAIGKATHEQVRQYQSELITRQIAFAHALRLHLRKQNQYSEFQHLLSADEYHQVIQSQNIPNYLLLTQGKRIKEGMRAELLGPFDNISIEPTIAGLSQFQGGAERIKNTPLLRQYNYYSRVFLYVFLLCLPFGLVADLQKLNLTTLLIPISFIIGFVFSTIAKVGEVNEDPFENLITDVPLTSICITIERDLLEMLGTQQLPNKIVATKGIVY